MLKGKLDQSPGWGIIVYGYTGWFFCGLSVFIMQFIFADMMSSLAAYWFTLPFIYYYLTRAYYRKYPDEPPLYVSCLFLMLLLVTDQLVFRFFYGGVGWEKYLAAPPWGQYLLRSWIGLRFTTGTWISFIIIPATTYLTGKSIIKQKIPQTLSQAG